MSTTTKQLASQMTGYNGSVNSIYYIATAIYNHWTGLVDWTGGLMLKIIFMLSNDTHSPLELCGSPAALFLAIHTRSQSKQVTTVQYS